MPTADSGHPPRHAPGHSTGHSAASPRADCAAIVVAGGQGLRFGGLKQYRELRGRRVLDHSLAAAAGSCGFVALVVPPDLTGRAEEAVDVVVAGGETRSESVRAGLAAVPVDCRVIVVHDAVRPLADAELFDRVVAAVDAGADAAVPGIPLVDTLRLVDGGVPTLGRDELIAVQTPQAFAAPLLRQVYSVTDAEATDDATLVSRAGGTVVVVPGTPENVKITGETDLVIADALLAAAEHAAVDAGDAAQEVVG